MLVALLPMLLIQAALCGREIFRGRARFQYAVID
jgi:hypothetical protein